MMVIKSALRSLRDIDHSMGSFIIGSNNAMIGRDAPRSLDDNTLEGVGRRLVNSVASSQAMTGHEGGDIEDIALRFTRGALVGRSTRHGLMVLMGSPDLDVSTARVAMAVCGRNLDELEPHEILQELAPAAPQPAQQPTRRASNSDSIWA